MLEGLLVPFLLWRCGASLRVVGPLALLLCVCPLVRTSGTADFCMRVSVPVLFVLALACVDLLVGYAERASAPRRLPIPAIALVVVLGIGAITPLWELTYGTSTVLSQGLGGATRDEYVSFEDHLEWPRSHFVVSKDSQTSWYFRYLAAEK